MEPWVWSSALHKLVLWYIPMLLALRRHRQEDQRFKVVFSYRASLRPLLGYRRLCVKKEEKCLKAFPDGDKGKRN